MQPEVRVMLDKMEDPVVPAPVPAPTQQPSALTQADIKDRFYRHFQQECTEIQEQIALLEDYSLVGGEKQDAINHVLSGISRLSTEVSDSSGLIPAYDQRIYAQVRPTASPPSVLSSCLLTRLGNQSP
jgi:tubulin-specific chaperone C